MSEVDRSSAGRGQSTTDTARRIAEIEAELESLTAELATLRRTAIQPDVQSIAPLPAEIAARIASFDAAPQITQLALLSDRCERLTLIDGIDAAAAERLNVAGISTFADIAALTSEDVVEIGRMLGEPRRVGKQCWIEQAALLAEGIETAYVARTAPGALGTRGVAALESGATTGRDADIIKLSTRVRLRASTAPYIRSGTLAASVAALAILPLSASDLLKHLLASLGLSAQCTAPLAAHWSGCMVAMIP